MRSGGEICLCTGNRKCKDPEAGKSAGNYTQSEQKEKGQETKESGPERAGPRGQGQGDWVFI